MANLKKDDEWMMGELQGLLESRRSAGDLHITKEELERIMRWKLARGKWRPALPGLVRQNAPAAVLAASRAAFKALQKKKGGQEQALKALSELRGIGPATASAVLMLIAPRTSPFMADEAMEAVPALGARVYTLPHYLHFSAAMAEKAATLGDDWNAELVGRALWTAAKGSVVLPEATAVGEGGGGASAAENKGTKRKRT